MKRSSYSVIGLFLLVTMLCTSITQARDTVYLKSGRILHGKVTEGEAKKGGDFIRLTTESGSVYVLDKGDIVKSIIKREQVDKDYEVKVRHIRNIATDHIELAKWCEKQDRGKTRFREQIRWHYANVVRLDPDHEVARKKLGYMRLDNGTWVAKAEFMARQGYLPDRRRDWVAQLSKEVVLNDERIDSELGAKKKELNMWIRQAKKGNYQATLLAKICDPSTLGMIYQNAIKAQYDVELCRIHLDAIATVRSSVAIEALAHFAVEAPKQAIREHAISLLSQREIDNVTVIVFLREALKSPRRWHIHNAAFAIAEVASTDEFSRDHAILQLSKALITQHEEKIEGALEPGRMNPSFGSGGGGLQMGGGPQTRRVDYKNQPCLDALRRLCEVDFLFNEQAWEDWYIENYTLSDINVRVDR